MKRLLSLLLAIILVFSSSAFALKAVADELFTVKISGVYYQTQARALLSKVNAFRTNAVTSDDPNKWQGDQAWAWTYGYDKNNNLYYYKKAYTRAALTYDYELEQIAMQRAAEIAVYYVGDHTRPNGYSWRTAHTQYNEANGYSIGENIFAVTNCGVQDSANAAFEEWLESRENYSYQSHRRNILGAEYPFVSTALACYEVNEVFFWVELFRSKNMGTTSTTVSSDPITKDISLNSKFVKTFEFTYPSLSLSLPLGESQPIVADGQLITTNHILSYYNSAGTLMQIPTQLQVVPALKSANTNIITVSGNTITAKNAGTTTLTLSAFGVSTTYTVTVPKSDLAYADITLKQPLDTFIYTGAMIKPEIASVTLGSTTLKAGDYEITYGENIQVGDGIIAISGRGNYEGAVSKSFHIVTADDCPHYEVSDAAVAPTCISDGKTAGSHCAICGTVFTQQRVVPAGDDYHQIVTEPAVEPDCTNNGWTAGARCTLCYTVFASRDYIPALGHTYPAGYSIVKASLTKNGSVYQRCEVCNAAKIAKYLYYPKTFKLSKTAFVYTGKNQRPTLAIYGADGKVISAAHYTASIPYGKNVGRYTVTVKFKGNYYAGTKTLYFDVLPKNTSKFTASAAKKAIKTAWTTQKVQTTGYQIQYSLYSNFKTSKTFTLKNPKYAAATISGLTGGKKHYIRIRTYRTVKFAGKNLNLFSPWSAVKTVTPKK